MPNTPKGFLFAVADAGFRKKRRNDTALVLSLHPASAAGVFTLNRFCAAPVVVGKEILAQARTARGVLVNSGQANACTGDLGLRNCKSVLSMMAGALELIPQDFLPASTGVIGEQFDMEKWENVIPELVDNLGKNSAVDFAEAIMTTDAFYKLSSRQVNLAGGGVSLMGMAKGAGMICPNMATMISVVLCDAQVEPELWQKLFSQAVGKTFNRVSVDGDTSTNDTVYGLANGASGVAVAEEDVPVLLEALTGVLAELAYMLVSDGEGATKVMHVNVSGAKNDADAELVARTIGHSPLVKTAIYGHDANWGRIVAAIGRSGADFDPNQVRVSLCGHEIFADGQPVDFNFDPILEPLLKEADIAIDVVMGSGAGKYQFQSSDLGHAYIDCNASYRS
jgi:N-acetylglutamate synthase (EC 2.3.1.1)/glutamate N-acetyltransferase (EC 2.3.1.35)